MSILRYNIPAVIHGVNGYGLQQSPLIFTCTLAANTAEALTVPAEIAVGTVSGSNPPYIVAVFSYKPNASVWISINGTAAVPAGGTFAASASELNPNCRLVRGSDVISALSATASTDLSIAFYAITL